MEAKMREGLKGILDREFFEKLPNKDVANEKLYLICFSGIPESGISQLARRIAEKYRGILIDKDQCRTLVYQNEKVENTQQVEDILNEYMKHFLENLVKLPNKLLVWDASIDRRHDKYHEFAEKHEYAMFVISMDTPHEQILAQIKERRDPQTAEWFLDQTERWTEDYKKYNESGQVDFVVKNKSEEDIARLFEKLDQLLT